MELGQLVIIQQFLKIHEEEGPAAAIAWAAKMEASLEEPESSGKQRHLRIVD